MEIYYQFYRYQTLLNSENYLGFSIIHFHLLSDHVHLAYQILLKRLFDN